MSPSAPGSPPPRSAASSSAVPTLPKTNGSASWTLSASSTTGPTKSRARCAAAARNLLALVVSTIENPFFTEVARAAEQRAHHHGYTLLISNTDENLERERAYFEIFSQQLVAGVILAPAPGDVSSRDYLHNPALPVVLVNRRLDGVPCPSIDADDEEAAFICVISVAPRTAGGASRRSRDSPISQRPRLGRVDFVRALTDAGLA